MRSRRLPFVTLLAAPIALLSAAPAAQAQNPPLTLTGTQPGSHQIRGDNLSTADQSVGVSGRSLAATGLTFGLRGASASSSGRGVFGIANAAVGETYGVYGFATSTSGRGVFGIAASATGTTFGVFGRSESADGFGVYGFSLGGTGVRAESTTGTALEVLGDARFNDFPLLLSAASDQIALRSGVADPFAGQSVNGPVLIGSTAGALGTASGGEKIALMWNQLGRVGIGTTAPAASLHVAGGAIMPSTGAAAAGIEWPALSGSDNAFVRFLSQGAGDGRLLIGTGGAANNDVAFYQNGAVRMKIENGNVGIGTTAAAVARLQVNGGAFMPAYGPGETAGILFPPDPAGGSGDRAFIRYYSEGGENTKLLIGNNNDGDDDISFYQLGGERLTIQNGNVGVGTTTPAAKFVVSGAEPTSNGLGACIRLSNTAAGGTDWFLRVGATGTNTPARGFSLSNNSFYRFTIDDAGNVGLGTLTPAARLQIAGGNLVFEHAFDVERSIANAAALSLVHDVDNDTAASNFHIYVNGLPGSGTDIEQFRILDGNDAAILGDGTFTSNGFDYAESFRVPDETIEPGDVVSLLVGDRESCTRSAAAYDGRAFGVVSERPSFLCGASFDAEESADAEIAAERREARAAGDEERDRELTVRLRDAFERSHRPIALAGRVACKVIGPVNAGDFLASSDTPGHAIAMTHAGPSIGVALEDWSGDAPGKVLALIQPGWRDPDGATQDSAVHTQLAAVERSLTAFDLAGMTGRIESQAAQIAGLERENADLRARLERIEAALSR